MMMLFLRGALSIKAMLCSTYTTVNALTTETFCAMMTSRREDNRRPARL